MSELQQGLALGFGAAAAPVHLLALFAGAMLGTAAGVLPGVGSVVAVALLLPLLPALDAVAALIMLAAVYYGAQVGSSVAAILVGPSGASGNDGYQMALQGRAGRALSLAAFGSFIAGCVGTALVAVVTGPLAWLMQGFGPAETFVLILFVLLGTVVLASGSLIKGLAMAVTGLLLSQIGIDPGTGVARYPLGIAAFEHGIGLPVLALGLLVCGELIARLDPVPAARAVFRERLGWLWPTLREARAASPAMLRGTVLGAVLGVLPGGGATLSAWASQRLEQRLASHDDGFGRGDVRGVGGPESANSAGAQTAFIPLLALGIPTSAVMALLFGAMVIVGAAPGPRWVTEHGSLFWSLVASMWIGHALLLVAMLALAPLWRGLLRLPQRHVLPLLLLLCALGAWSLEQRSFEVWAVAAAGVLGYALHKFGCEIAPLLLGFVLGPAMELSLRRALTLAHGDWGALLTRPVVAALLIACAALLLALLWPSVRHRRAATFVED